MESSLLSAWGVTVKTWIVDLFEWIFPEFPEVGVGVCAFAAILFIYYAVRRRDPGFAAKTALSVMVSLIIFLYGIHTVLRLWKVVI